MFFDERNELSTLSASYRRCLLYSLANALNALALKNLYGEGRIIDQFHIPSNNDRKLPYLSADKIGSAGFTLKIISLIDQNHLIQNPEEGLKKVFGEASKNLIQELDPDEIKPGTILSCIHNPNVSFETKSPTVGDIKNTIDDGGVCVISCKFSANENGVSHHYMAVTSYNKEGDFLIRDQRRYLLSSAELSDKLRTGNINRTSGAGGFLINIYPKQGR